MRTKVGLGVTLVVALGLASSGCGSDEDIPVRYDRSAERAYTLCQMDVDPTTADEKRLPDVNGADAFTLSTDDGRYVAVYWNTEAADSDIYCPGDYSGMYAWDGEQGKWVKP